MSFKSHIPFHRQISGSLVFLYLSFLFIIGIASFLLYLRNVQVDELVNNQIPEIEFSYQYNQLLLLNNKHVLTLKQSQSISELSDAFYNIKENVDNISALYLINMRKLNALVTNINEVEEIVERIKNNAPRNITLKQTSIVQLRILINTLVEQIEYNKKIQVTLHKQITSSGVNSTISTGDAIRYIDITRVLEQLNKALLLFDEATLGFELLTINYSVEGFVAITGKIDLAVSTWLSVLTSKSVDIMTRSKIEDLQNLLNVEQRVLAKWHSHLRLAEEVLDRVKSVNTDLNNLYSQDKQRVNLVSSNYLVPEFVTQTLRKIPYELSVQQYYYGLIGLVIASLLLTFTILLRLRTRIQKYGDNTVNLCESLLLDNSNKQKQDDYVETAEQLRIVGLIHQIQKPEHSENQYQLLANTQERDLTFINKHHNIVIWQYQPFVSYIEVINFTSNIPNSPNLNNWRQLLTRKTLSEVIAVAKIVRDSKESHSCYIKTESGIQLEIFIGFDGITWFGTLSRNEILEEIKSTVVTLKNKLKNKETHSIEELSVTTDNFSKMVLRAMLQSQGVSIDFNGSSLPVYRQLARIFDWCRQTNIVMQLQHTPRNLQNSNISFKDELHAIVFNAMSEAHLQRNQIYLQTDRLLLNFASVEHRLFHRMLLGMIKVTLAELFNAKMLLDLKVVDRDTGSQTVQFTLTVSPTKRLKALPDLVSRLVNEDVKSAPVSDIIFYIKTLMQRFNINQVQSELHDDGFKVIFNMPLVEQKSHPTEKKVKTASLKKISFVSLSACPFSQRVISNCINAADGMINTVSSIDELTQHYSAEILERKTVNLIIIGGDISRSHLGDVQNYLNSLPKSLQPKLFVMQSPMNTPYHKVGLYNQASMPLCQEHFQIQILELLASDSLDNKLIEADVLSQYQYQSTRVEVLLAVLVPEEHQVLIRILQWLGLQVHVVSQPIAMAKHWQSGRYLLLISEFTQSPFIMLSTGRNVQRGIFTFKDMLFDTPTGNILNATKHWKVSTLPNVLDIKALVLLLEPWLKPKREAINNTVKTINSTAKIQQSFNEFISDTNTLNEEDKEYLNYSQLLTDNANELEKNNILDMEKYAFNQGSSELAAYMIDEYISDIDNAILALEQALKSCTFEHMIKPSQVILKLSDVMATSDLKDACEAFITLLNNKNKKDQLSKYANAIGVLRLQFKCLADFTETI